MKYLTGKFSYFERRSKATKDPKNVSQTLIIKGNMLLFLQPDSETTTYSRHACEHVVQENYLGNSNNSIYIMETIIAINFTEANVD